MLSFILPLLLASPSTALALPAQKRVERSDIPYSSNVVPFTRRSVASDGLRLARFNRFRELSENSVWDKIVDTVPLNAPGGADSYSIEISVDGQVVEVIADTGSSDLWVPTTDFQCLDINSTQLPQAECMFGPTFFNVPNNLTLLPYANNFNISYGDLEFVSGYGAIAPVAVGNITVPNAELGISDIGYWSGDNTTNGLLGLANPLLTSIYYGTDGSVDGKNNSAVYLPWFYQAVKDGLVDPFFSLVISRVSLAVENTTNVVPGIGSITFGGQAMGYPTVEPTVTVPNVLFNTSRDHKNVSVPAYYTVVVDSFNFPGSDELDTTTQKVILDSGTTLLYFPNNVSAALNSQWSPAAVYSDDEAAYIVECDATPPPLSVTIGGKAFTTEAVDLIYPSYTQPGMCISTVVNGGADQEKDVFILGDRFMVNVISTFNIANNDITVTQRQNYTACY